MNLIANLLTTDNSLRNPPVIIYTVIYYITYWSSGALDPITQVQQLTYHLHHESHIIHCHQNTIETNTRTILLSAKVLHLLLLIFT
jgi:hypothetical protein